MKTLPLRRYTLAAMLLALGIGLLVALLPAYGNSPSLTPRSVVLQDASPGATTQYTFNFTVQNAQTIGSIGIMFCSNSPLEGDTCDAPTGFTAANATLSAQSGFSDLSIYSKTANSVVLSHTAAAVTPPLPISIALGNITNPSASGSYYLRISTYTSTDGSGSSNAFGGVAYSINSGLNVSTTVPPYITLCSAVTINNFDCNQATGNYINFGDLTTTAASSADSQVFIATNAASGYALFISGPTLTSGNNTIPSLQGADISRPGVDQFGINLRANQDPAVGADPAGSGSGTVTAGYNTPNEFQYVSGDAIASNTTGEAGRLYTISYLININKDQQPGVYATTMIYTALANF